MKIEILGKGCKNCLTLENNTKEALQETGQEAEVIHVTDIKAITDYGVMMTPALVIDGQVKSTGRVLSAEEIKKILV